MHSTFVLSTAQYAGIHELLKWVIKFQTRSLMPTCSLLFGSLFFF